MTTSVTIKNNGPHPVNVNEVELQSPAMADKEKLVQSHGLEVGAEVTVNIWGFRRYLCVIEQGQ